MTAYRLKSIRLPRLTGWTLKFFSAAIRWPVIGKLLAHHLFHQTGLVRFRQTRIDEPPAFHPQMAWSMLQSEQNTKTGDAPQIGTAEPVSQKSLPLPTISDYAEAYRSGETSPETVARSILASIDSPRHRQLAQSIFICQDRADIMAQAAESTRRLSQGKPRSILEGVPVAVKDEIDQIPYPTSAGTTFLGRTPAAADATAVRRLRNAGAMLIGKTNMREIGIAPNSLNDHYGTLRNPHDLSREAGGSSSGSAVAVASGLCPAALGADGGGSIRVPAAHCGVVGLKPTYGRVSEHGAVPLCWSVAHLGPIGISVEDVAAIYEIIAGPDARDPLSTLQPQIKAHNWKQPALNSLVIGIYPRWFEHCLPGIATACRTALGHLQDLGAQLLEIEISDLDEMRVAHAVIILSEMSASMAGYRAHFGGMGASTRISLELGSLLTASDYVHAQRMRTRAARVFQEVFEKVDAVITPTTAITAPKLPIGAERYGWSDLGAVTELMRFVFPANLLGLPAVSFPVGYDDAGMPIGMQAIGRCWEEHTVLRIARGAESYLERKKPPSGFEILDSSGASVL